MKETPPIESEIKVEEKEQTPEEIREVLETALREECPVDLIISTLEGEPRFTPDLLVEEIDGDYLMMTYLDEKGELGELIPLEFSRVKKAELRKLENS